ncbi:putative membrane protein [Mycobacterium xenopi 4042]|uniref:Putative membrane protein n=1 Tax=Mycobacterium xenopi 4042 TaxID=1299334 RepID=X8AI39_MYCXE|nr:putative membrane protein [Mycobacterium xenopi 4042]
MLFWSSIGVVCVMAAAYVYTAWIVSGDATPVSAGPDRIPAGTRAAMAAFQVLCPVFAVAAVFYVVRKSLRERQLCVEAAIVIGSTVAWWHDPLINWFQPTLFYNAGLVNFGNWTENIPGWLSPDGRLMAEPVLMIGMIYIWMPLAMGMIARWAMGRARAKWPALGPVRTFCCGWLAVYVIEFPLEIFAVHNGLVGYPAAIPGVTLWRVRLFRFPCTAHTLVAGADL